MTQMVSQKPLILILSLNLAGHAIHSIINGRTFSQNDLGMSNIRLLQSPLHLSWHFTSHVNH